MYRQVITVEDKDYIVDIWDTAGQDQYATLHSSFYFNAHACILTFDVTRKVTYDNLNKWYPAMRKNCPNIPCLLVANKIDCKCSN